MLSMDISIVCHQQSLMNSMLRVTLLSMVANCSALYLMRPRCVLNPQSNPGLTQMLWSHPVPLVSFCLTDCPKVSIFWSSVIRKKGQKCIPIHFLTYCRSIKQRNSSCLTRQTKLTSWGLNVSQESTPTICFHYCILKLGQTNLFTIQRASVPC